MNAQQKHLHMPHAIFAFSLFVIFFTAQTKATDDAIAATNLAKLRVLSFNILQGGGNAANVGFRDQDFGGSRLDEIAAVIRCSNANVVGIQEDDRTGKLLAELGKEWTRVGSVYSTFKLTSLVKANWLTVVRVETAKGPIVVANCHWRPSKYGPFLVQDYLRKNGVPNDLIAFEQAILKESDRTSGDRGYQQTVDAIRPLLESGETVVLTGDFNEPSHLDWTKAAAENGMDRWVKNATATPLRFPISWKGSQVMKKLGLKDAYRTRFPNETQSPGNTWPPPYPDKTPGRRPYSDQVLDRIDMIYFAGKLKLQNAAVIGESKGMSDIVFKGRWPSDHRAVLSVFDVEEHNSKVQNAEAITR